MVDSLIPLAATLALAIPLAMASQLPPASVARNAMDKVAGLLAGKWRESGTVRLVGRQSSTLACTLTAASKADGTVLLMDAPYSLTPPDRPAEATAHDEIAVLSFDPATGNYRFDVFYADGRHETGSATLEGAVLRIVNVVPGAGFRRLTIDLTSPDVYHETGERSRDGSVWEAYSDLVLTRVRH
jgi:hypothetical protein